MHERQKKGESVIEATFAAPWDKRLIISSVVCVIILLAVSAPVMSLARVAGWITALTLSLIALTLIVAASCIILGYTVTREAVTVRRLGWSTRFPRDHLESVSIAPYVMKGSLRTFGIGGLFSYTGYYRNNSIGAYRAFVTDHARTVVLRWPTISTGSGSIVVVSPHDPAAFVTALEGDDSGLEQ